MSILYYLLFLFLSLSLLHACHARPLGSNVDDKKLEKKYRISNNKNEETSDDKVPVLPKTNKFSALSNELGATKGDGVRETSCLGDNNAQKGLKDTKANQNISDDDEGPETTSGTALKTDESLVSVSWRLPRNKRGGKHPGFNSDYSPPKTHPPSHN